MLRTLHVAILCNAALLVPVDERSEWLAEWKAELCYVEHDATAFCLGSFRDAMWLRRNSSVSLRGLFNLDSPLRCMSLLGGLAMLTSLWAFGLPTKQCVQAAFSPSVIKQFSFDCFWFYVESMLILLTLNPLALGEYPANCYAPRFAVRLRRWIFLAAKIATLAPIFLFASIALLPIFPPALWILFLGWILGFRWALADQRQRCPVCLHWLSNPVRIGSPTQSVLQWYGTELICTRGHGLLYVPGAPTTWCNRQRWQYLDPTWSNPLP